jgi:hypothetical protein
MRSIPRFQQVGQTPKVRCCLGHLTLERLAHPSNKFEDDLQRDD